MKNPKIALFLSALLLAPAAFADDDDDRYDPTYSSIRLTSVTTDFDNLDRAVNLGFTLGVNIPGIGFLPDRVLAAEIDLSSTLIPGENQGTPGPLGGGGGGGNCDLVSESLGLCTPDSGGGGGGSSSAKQTNDPDDLRMNAVGIFLTGRSPGQFFGLGRIGYRFVETTISELNEEQSGSAWGLGLGYRYSENGTVELTYSQYGSDIKFMSLVVSY